MDPTVKGVLGAPSPRGSFRGILGRTWVGLRGLGGKDGMLTGVCQIKDQGLPEAEESRSQSWGKTHNQNIKKHSDSEAAVSPGLSAARHVTAYDFHICGNRRPY